jgi:hypothetical protein
MAQLSYPTELKIPVPILINHSQLIGLDAVLDQYSGRLRDEQEVRIQARIERVLSRRSAETTVTDERRRQIDSEIRAEYERERRSVAVYLSGGSTLTANRFEEAVNQPHLTRELPLGFRCDLEIGQVGASIALRSSFSSGLDIVVRPNSSVAAQELFGALENWASGIAPASWQRFWLAATFWTRIFLFFWLILGLPFMFFGFQQEAKEVYQPEAKQILQQGVNSNNQQKALELTLAIVSGAGPKSGVFRPGVRGWGYWLAGFLLLVVLSFCPEVVVGIWKGKGRLSFWRFWIQTVWVSIPALILTTVIWPQILSLFGMR